MPLIQKFIIHAPEDASSLLPAHIALAADDGSPVLGELEAFGDVEVTADDVAAAYDALVGALIDAGLAKAAPAAPVDEES